MREWAQEISDKVDKHKERQKYKVIYLKRFYWMKREVTNKIVSIYYYTVLNLPWLLNCNPPL